MKAVDFIKKFGWDEAKRIIGMSRKHGKSGLHYSLSDELYYGASMNDRISVDDLKQLVDAWVLVQKHGGLKSAIETYNCFKNACDGVSVKHSPKMIILKQAIELVESVNEQF